MTNELIHQTSRRTLDAICETLYAYEFDEKVNISILSGKTGIVLLFAGYYKLTLDVKYADKLNELVVDIIEQINRGEERFNYSSGIAGFGWVLDFLMEDGLIEEFDFLQPLESVLGDEMTRLFKANNWDALHGGLGIAFYFLNRIDKESAQSYVVLALNEIEELAQKDKEGLKWVHHNPISKIDKVNLGLAHGISSVIVFLTQCIKKKIEVERCKLLLNEAVNYVLKQRHTAKNCISLFPSNSEDVNKSSSLAWCQGDLGIIASLIQANEVIGGLDKEVYQMVGHALQRKALLPNRVLDAGFCHGAGGILVLFLYYKNKGVLHPDLDETIAYWHQVTLDFGECENGLGGFQYVMGRDLLGSSYAMLDGLASTGLSLLSFENELSKWQKALFLF